MLHKKRKPSTFTSSSGFADCKRNAASNNNMLHSKSTYFYRWIPISCSLALLLGLGIIVNPVVDKVEPVYAATDDECKTTPDDKGVCAMELGITMQGSDGSDVVGAYTEQPATALSTDTAAFRSYSFKVRAIDTDKDGYKLYANAVPTTLDGKDYTNKLVNADYPEFSINPLGAETTGTAIPAGQWGYALTKGDNTSAAASGLTYKAVPTGTTETATPVDTDTDTDLVNDIHTDRPYKIHFGARADEGMAAGHYRTQVLLSLVASPKKIAKGGLGGVQKMSEFTSAICKSLPTPATNAAAADIPTGQLIDDREGDNGTKYWVAKLADGDCWMTQNMAYSGISNKSGNFSETNKNKVLNGGSAADIGTRTPSEDPLATAVFPDADTYNAHFRIGNYYAQSNNQAADACNFASKSNSDWKLPTAPSSGAASGSFRALTNAYGATSGTSGNGSSDANLIKAPLFFLRAGSHDPALSGVGGSGNYWSSTSGYILFFDSSQVVPADSGNVTSSRGFSVRCVVSGA